MTTIVSNCGGTIGPRLTATKSLTSGSIGVEDDVLTYTVVVENVGDADATNVVITDSLSPIVIVSDPDGLETGATAQS